MLLFDSLRSYTVSNILRSVKRWLNNIYKDKNTQDFEETVSYTIFDSVKYIDQMVSDVSYLFLGTGNINFYHSLIFTTNNNSICCIAYSNMI